jgi:hypothetical protein
VRMVEVLQQTGSDHSQNDQSGGRFSFSTVVHTFVLLCVVRIVYFLKQRLLPLNVYVKQCFFMQCMVRPFGSLQQVLGYTMNMEHLTDEAL